MMKNSKLSKLLVAGVSVAVLASAVAPMAFAEETSGVALAPEDAFVTVQLQIDTTKGKFNLPSSVTTEKGNNNTETYTVGSYKATELDTKINLDVFEANETCELDTWQIDDVEEYNDPAWNAIARFEDVKLNTKTSTTVRELVKASKVIDNTAKHYKVILTPVVDNVTYIHATLAGNYRFPDDFTYVEYNDFATLTNKTENDADGKNFATSKNDVKLPSYVVADGKVFLGWTLKVGNTASTVYTDDNPFTGNVFDLSSDKEIKAAVKIANDTAVNVVFTPVIGDVAKVTLKINPNAEGLAGIEGVSYTDRQTIVAYANNGKTVASGDVVELPNVTTKTAGWTFSYWIGKPTDDGTKITLADGTKVSSYKFTDGKFDASKFADEQKITVTPVFVKGTDKPVVTYDPVKTPNDSTKKYIDGKYDSAVDCYGNEIDFEGGLFYNQVDETFAYYLPINSEDKWEIDTTVNGIADGVFFADGKQDTEAYGLKKVSGAAEDDKFFYLVSDGLYVDDYTGIWVDEDGSIYNLINGCTSDVPFTGIVEKDGWATSVKDSKVDDKANGFILYGDTQYWFINGTCNLNETEAVREHTDGNFYYTVGAKIDFTFNGECNGHTFVNGVASK